MKRIAAANKAFARLADPPPMGAARELTDGLRPAVRFWLRNVDRKPNAFGLQLSSARFYPDFVAMLTDGGILLVRYKGKHLAEGARDKRMVGGGQ